MPIFNQTPIRVHLCSSVAKLFSIVLMAVALAGCKSAKVAQPLTADLSGNDPESQMEFWHALAERPVTSNDEAFHGLMLYLDQKDDAADYAGRVSTLKSRGLLPPKFDRPADESISRGVLAVAIVRALEIKGGWVLRVAPRSPRYATRELMYMNLYPVSSPNQTFTGNEFLGIIGRMEDYQRSNPAEVPAAVLPSEMEAQKEAREGATPPGVPEEQEQPKTAAPVE